MNIREVFIIELGKYDLKEDEIDKPRNEIHWSDFKELTQDKVNKAFIILYADIDGYVVIKNKFPKQAGDWI